MKILINDWATDNLELKTIIDNETKIKYYSEKANAFLVTDSVFDKIKEKYDLSDIAVYDSLEEFSDTYFQDYEIEVFNKTYYLSEGSEDADENMGYNVDETGEIISTVSHEDWYDDLKEYLLTSLSIYIASQFEEVLHKMNKIGFDLGVMQDIVDRCFEFLKREQKEQGEQPAKHNEMNTL